MSLGKKTDIFSTVILYLQYVYAFPIIIDDTYRFDRI